jgi:hypothetical protein
MDHILPKADVVFDKFHVLQLLIRHLDGIAAYCFHAVRFGVVESINTTIKAGVRTVSLPVRRGLGTQAAAGGTTRLRGGA